MAKKTVKSDEEWGALLNPIQYKITRKKGTERAFTGQYFDHKDRGLYCCICCKEPLFSSKTKYDSRTGWPSFWAPIEGAHISEIRDRSFFIRRTEVICAACDAHLGHVFKDGPQPTGLRYCINSAALDFKKTND